MLTELEFAQERYRQFILFMPILVEEANSTSNGKAELEAKIDELLDEVLRMQRNIRRLKKVNNEKRDD